MGPIKLARIDKMSKITWVSAAVAVLLATAGCAVLDESGRHLSRPVTGENYPESIPGKIVMAPVAGVTLLADDLIVHPALVVPKALWRAGEISGMALAVPKTGLKIILPDILAYPIYLPFWAVGTVVVFPATWFWYGAIPGTTG
jgi:hypothetical protein